MGDGPLIAKCLEEGEKTERATDIYVMKLQHSGGIIYVYKNDTSGSTLNEELGLELTGLCIEDQDDQTMVNIDIGLVSRKSSSSQPPAVVGVCPLAALMAFLEIIIICS